MLAHAYSEACPASEEPHVVGGASGAAALKGGAAAVPNVCWSGLTIRVPRRGGACAAVLDPLGRFARDVLNLAVDPDDEFTAVRDVSGVLREGELVIVLGPAGSGRSALLRAISGRLNAAEELGGRLSCGGRTVACGDRRWRRATTYVSAEDDTHAPELTVFETLRFAATLNVGEERADEVVLSMLDTMGLAHVKDTVVGDAKLRGVSGGQKRRVTVGEMLLLRGSRFWFLDDMDRGLDGVTALGLVQMLRDACKGRSLAGASRAGNSSSKIVPPAAGRAGGAGGGAMITLNSPSDEMLALADRLLVLNDQGQLAYFGSAAADVVRAHFAAASAAAGAAAAKGAPASLCELVLQSVSAVGSSGRSAELFAASALAQELASELAALGGSTTSSSAGAGAGAADEWSPDNGDQERAAAKFAQSRWVQLRAIAVRKSKLIARNPMTVARVLIAALFAVFVASLFSVLPNTLIGAYSIAGLVFLLEFIVLMLSAQVTIPLFFRERKTVSWNLPGRARGPASRHCPVP
jgi:ATP-binding cassette subfamily G (WHITE) protein 2 (SNQ2)